jgi:hypothetical protein
MAGYSGTPLPKKLGIAAGARVAWMGAPADFMGTLGPLPDGVTVSEGARGRGPFDVILLFVRSRAELAKHFAAQKSRLTPAGGLWVAWPKKASGIVTDMTEDVAREIGLPQGLVDNKVCAIDDTWSGLRFVIRLKDRPTTVKPRAIGAGAKAQRARSR